MDNTQTLIEEWYKRVSVTQVAHYHSSDYFGKMKYRLGVPAIAFATFAGTTVFATLQQQSNICLLYTSPSPRDLSTSRMPSSA